MVELFWFCVYWRVDYEVLGSLASQYYKQPKYTFINNRRMPIPTMHSLPYPLRFKIKDQVTHPLYQFQQTPQHQHHIIIQHHHHFYHSPIPSHPVLPYSLLFTLASLDQPCRQTVGGGVGEIKKFPIRGSNPARQGENLISQPYRLIGSSKRIPFQSDKQTPSPLDFFNSSGAGGGREGGGRGGRAVGVDWLILLKCVVGWCGDKNITQFQMQKDLDITAVIGFSGNIYDGLLLHPDNEHIIYPLGSTVVVRHILSRTQTFLRGHNHKVSSIKISKDGKHIASAEHSFPGQVAEVLLWDFEKREVKHRFKLHKNSVTSLAFSPDSRLLASQGCLQDKNMLVIWDVESGKSLYGAPNKEVVNEILFFNNDSSRLIAVQHNGIQILTIDQVYKKIQSLNANFGNVKRQFTYAAIDYNDAYVYCGTKTGDIFEVNIEKAIYKRVGPVKRLFSLGISAIRILPNGDLIVGTGEGKLARISIQNMNLLNESEVMGNVTSISFTGDYTHFFCGTSQSNIYWVNSTNLTPELRNTCHYERINDVAFPYNYSDVFATAAPNEIRIWNSKNRQELLRIQVPGLDCYSVAFMQDGKSIVSGWSDGKIRAFLPQSGKLLYVINDAHNHGCTSVTATSDGERIISGGAEGEIRIWKITKQTQVMEASMKEHRSRVWSIQISRDNSQAVSASSDGSCIIWDLKSRTRLLCLFESTAFKQAILNTEEYQILTAGSDRKITYWEKYDGQIIRSVEGSQNELNTLDITAEGKHFISGGQDGRLRIWNYDEGICYFEGEGHSGSINKVKISPDQRTIITVGSEGAIFFWNMPASIIKDKVEPELPTLTKGPQKTEEKSVKSSVKGSVKGSVKK